MGLIWGGGEGGGGEGGGGELDAPGGLQEGESMQWSGSSSSSSRGNWSGKGRMGFRVADRARSSSDARVVHVSVSVCV